MALQAPIRFNNEMPSGSPFDVIWDSGTSITVSPNQSDFVRRYEKPPMMIKLSGLARGLNIKGQGQVMWAVRNTEGLLRVIKVPAYHVPGCKICLLSTSSLLQTYIGEQIILDDVKLTLSGESNDPTRGAVIAMIDSSNNLPTSQFYNQSDVNMPVEVLETTLTTVNAKNYNLSEPQKELLCWHYRLGHLGFRKIQSLMRSGMLSHTQSTRSLHTAASKITTPPCCSACQIGKQTRRPSPGKVSSVVKDREGALKKDNLFVLGNIYYHEFYHEQESLP
jgi:hypothetical protein